MAETDRDKALDAALGQIEKQFGKGSVMRMGDNLSMNIESVPTGALSLDLALGIGGLPRGRIVEIYGPESSGKSTLAMHCVAEAQRNGGICAYVDAEHAMDPVYARAIGVNVDDLLISQPDTGEQALEIADMLIRSGALDVLVVDSVAALTPRAEIEGEMGDTHVGLQARLMSQALRKLTGTLSKSSTIAIFINQLREKIGVMYGSPEVTPGGRALKFYSSIRLDIRRIEAIKDGADVVGNRTRVKVVKNKCSAPFKQAEFDIMYGKGISREGSLLDVAVELGFVKKSGAWFTYEGEQLGQGRENVKTFLSENPQLMAEINDRVRECLAPADPTDELSDTDIVDPDEVPISLDPDTTRAPPPTQSIASHRAEASGSSPPLPRVTSGALRVRDRAAPTRAATMGPMPATGVEATGLSRLRPCGADGALPLPATEAVGAHGFQRRSSTASPTRWAVPSTPSSWRRSALPSRGCRKAGPLRGVPPPGAHRQRTALHAREPQRVRGRAAPGRPHPRPRRDVPGPGRRCARPPRLPLSLRASGGGGPPGRGARRDLPERLDGPAGALRARAGGVRLPFHGGSEPLRRRLLRPRLQRPVH